MGLANFRQLGLVGDHGMLGPKSAWENAECRRSVIKRPCVEAAAGEADGLANCMDLLQAAISGDLQHMIELLDKPHDPDAADRGSHGTPLLHASATGHLEVVECLLDAGADKDKADNAGCTPLHLAANQGHQAVVKCLLDAGDGKDKADNRGAQPLHLAANQGHQAKRPTTWAPHHCTLRKARAIRQYCCACLLT